MHQRIIKDQQRRAARFLQQVGIGEAADEPQLLARPEAQFLQLAALDGATGAKAPERRGREPGVHVQGRSRHQQRQVMLHARLRGLAFLFELAAKQRECVGTALQLGLTALRLRQLARHCFPLFFQALRPGQLQRVFENQQLIASQLMASRELLDAALQPIDVLQNDVRPRGLHVGARLLDAGSQCLSLGAHCQPLLAGLRMALLPARVRERGLRRGEFALR